MGITATLDLSLRGTYTKQKGLTLASFDLSTHPLLGHLVRALADGTGVGKGDLAWMTGTAADLSTPRTIAISGTDDLDLNNLLSDLTGDPTPFIKVKTILVYAPDTNAHDLLVGGAAANAFASPFAASTNKVTVQPGGILLLWAPNAGYLVTPGTADILRLANAGAVSTIDYHAAILGATA